jgi:hypothetical protein
MMPKNNWLQREALAVVAAASAVLPEVIFPSPDSHEPGSPNDS